ncbi:MAG TPA: RICIN domain-containing protein [Ktedonobacteraceae bacterium]|jgi:tetratricopeptide (TPR) repeat protein
MMLRIFVSYAHKDEDLLKELEEHLALLQNQGVIRIWHDRNISAGAEWEDEIDTHLSTAHIILLLVSASFLASKYCYSKEMKRAMERHHAGEARVIPVILRPVYWEGAPFGALQALPTKARPVTTWSNPEEAFYEVAKGIRHTIEELLIKSQPRMIALSGYETQGGSRSALWSDPGTFSLTQTYLEWSKTKRDFTQAEIVDRTWVKAGDHGLAFLNHFFSDGRLVEYAFADPATRWQGRWQLLDGILRTTIHHHGISELDILAHSYGQVHSGIESLNAQEAAAYFTFLPSQQETGRREEVLTAYDQLLRVNPHCARAYTTRGNLLRNLKRFEEALADYEGALKLGSQVPAIWTRKGEMLRMLQRYTEALAAYDQALKLEASHVEAFLGKGRVYLDLARCNEALEVYEQATSIAPENTWAWYGKGEALSRLGRVSDAFLAFEQALALDATNKWAWRRKAKALEQLASQAAQKAQQLFGENTPLVAKNVAEFLPITQSDPKEAAIYYIVAEFSNKVLTIQKDVHEDGSAALVHDHYRGDLNQQWQLVPVEEQYFKIVSCLNGEVLDVWMHKKEDGASVVAHRYLGGANQHWQLILIDGAGFTFKIVSQESDRVLDVWKYGKEDGTAVVTHRYLGGSNQHWRLVALQQQTRDLASRLTVSLLSSASRDAAAYLENVRKRLGAPLTSVQEAIPSRQGTGGWVQRFAGGSDDPQRASVYSSKYGAYPTWGWIAQCYESCGGTSGRLGFPVSPELDAWVSSRGTTGQVQRFEENASVYSSKYGAYPTWGGIGRCFENLGGTGGPLGFPTSSELEANRSPQGTTGLVQRFEDGDIYCSRDGEGVPVREPILRIFEQSGGSGDTFGFPKSPAISDPAHPGHVIQEFEGGSIQSFAQVSTQ